MAVTAFIADTVFKLMEGFSIQNLSTSSRRLINEDLRWGILSFFISPEV
ncbi:hypothetical protein [Methanolobus sp.]|nr:hypothetical protein [Methanolobus sp.]